MSRPCPDGRVGRAKEYGGYVSYKTDRNGMEVPYEINITWFSALRIEKDKCQEFGICHKIRAKSPVLFLLPFP